MGLRIMRQLAIVAVLIATCLPLRSLATVDGLVQAARDPAERRVIDNPRVRVYRISPEQSAGVPEGPGVAVLINGGAGQTPPGTALWVNNAADPEWRSKARGPILIVQPQPAANAAPLPAGSKPGEGQATGMSFNTVFENDRVSVLRARMEVGATEGVHTHGSDTVVIHVSGGQIEDTAGGKTVVHRWARGDAEFEARGSSHSMRNLGAAVDAVLVVIK